VNSGIIATRRSPYRVFATAAGFAVASTSMPAMAQTTEATELDSLTVVGEQNTGYKTESSASEKFVKPLLDTPQTVTTVPEEVIEEQQALSLRQVLSNCRAPARVFLGEYSGAFNTAGAALIA
jgi:catecholate siderophore receptor